MNRGGARYRQGKETGQRHLTDISNLFLFVLIKFFTNRKQYENKEATQGNVGEHTMMDTVLTALNRQNATLWQDALGALSLVVILMGVLHLPSLV